MCPSKWSSADHRTAPELGQPGELGCRPLSQLLGVLHRSLQLCSAAEAPTALNQSSISAEPDHVLVLSPHGAADDAQQAPLYVASPCPCTTFQSNVLCSFAEEKRILPPGCVRDQGSLQASPCSCNAEHQFWADLSGFSFHYTSPRLQVGTGHLPFDLWLNSMIMPWQPPAD